MSKRSEGVYPELEPESESGRSRRNLVQSLLSAGFVGVAFVVAFPLLKVLVPPKRTSEKDELIEVAPEGSIAEGDSKTVVGADGVPIIVFLVSGVMRALEKKCPHLGCMVDLVPGELDCPCHGARFTFEGKRIAGPSPRDLKKYSVITREGKVFVGAEIT